MVLVSLITKDLPMKFPIVFSGCALVLCTALLVRAQVAPLPFEVKDPSGPLDVQYYQGHDASAKTMTLLKLTSVVEHETSAEIDANGVARPKTVAKTVEVVERHQIPLADITAMNPRGEPLKLIDVLNELRRNQAVIISPKKELPSSWRNILRDNVVVLKLSRDPEPEVAPKQPDVEPPRPRRGFRVPNIVLPGDIVPK